MADGTAPAITKQLRLTTPLLHDFAYLAARMRPDEIAQWLAVTGARDYVADDCARAFANLAGPAYCWIDPDMRPVHIGGFEPVRAGVWAPWMMGTLDAWKAHGHAITRVSRRLMADMVANHGARRFQVYALANRRAAHIWYERGLGYALEGTHPGWYADGSDAVCYGWVKPVEES